MKPDEMKSSLKKFFVPALKSRGFRGSLPHFRRIGARQVDLLSVQFDRHGGGFIIEISKCPAEGFTPSWGKKIAPTKVTTWDLQPDQRHRLGRPRPGQDGHWFRFDDGTPTDSVANSAVSFLQEADSWWDPQLGQ